MPSAAWGLLVWVKFITHFIYMISFPPHSNLVKWTFKFSMENMFFGPHEKGTKHGLKGGGDNGGPGKAFQRKW